MQTTQTQNNATSLFRLQTNNTRNKNRNENIKHTKKKLPSDQYNSKRPELQGKQCFHRLKSKQESRQKQKCQN